MAIIYQNYHKHTMYSNLRVADSAATYQDYVDRIKELGQTVLTSCEHGFQGHHILVNDIAKANGLKFVLVAEAYWVKDRFEKDRSNCHIILAAKNENGRQCINEILADAVETGFYAQPRIDRELILSLPPKDVLVTTACIAFWRYEDVDDFVLELKEHFKDNFYLEVQYHETDEQRKLNRHILDLHYAHNIPLIMGCDSHFVYLEEASERDNYLESKGVVYEDEEGWYMDMPTGDEAYNRFARQGVLNHDEIMEAIENTNVFLTFEDYQSPIYDTEIKMPTIYPELTQEEKDEKLVNLIWDKWGEEKIKIDQNRWDEYESEIQKELDTIIITKHADYFLLNYEIIREGIRRGGKITLTGRGSAVSFYVNKLLGFTTVDRIAAPVKMFPERFMSPTRVLQTKSLADIDFNCSKQEPFEDAQKYVMGNEHAYVMVALGTLKQLAAWKMYARAKHVDFEISNRVSAGIEKYNMAVKHADDDDKDSIDITKYIPADLVNYYEESKKYQGIITDSKKAPCSYLLYNGNIRREIGLFRAKDNVCCLMDKNLADSHKFLKNDILKVKVVDLYYRIFERLGMEPLSIDELREKCDPLDAAWNMYKIGATCGLNQVEQHGATSMVSRYSPTNISELCGFVAAIRPGFKSMLNTYLDREDFEYGIPSFDKLIQTPEMPNSFVLYQEMAMETLNYAGIDMSECYAIIKAIAKKKVQEVFKRKEEFLKGFAEKIMIEEFVEETKAHELAEQVWQILEDSSGYSFNCCVAGDTKIQKGNPNGRFEPTVEEMYRIMNDKDYATTTGHIHLHKKYQQYGYGTALSMFNDKRIRKNKIVDIRINGIKEIYRVRTESGAFLDCTLNHKFPTPSGKKKLEELYVGDLLYVKGTYEKGNGKNYTFTKGDWYSNLPMPGERGFQLRPDGESVKFFAIRDSKVRHNTPCEHCGCEMTDTFELHHVDGDRAHNDEDNLVWLCNSCHKKAHYAMGRVRQYQKGIPTVLEPIVSIEYLRTDTTYDIEMQDPAHTYISESGLVTSNSHSYSVAGDSLYGAWQKAHHPLTFYECFLQLLDEDGEKDRMAAAREEAQKHFNITFPLFRWGQDNRSIVADKATNSITNSLTSIKGMSQSVADGLYEVAQLGLVSIAEIFVNLKEHGVSMAKIAELIKIDYFAELGNIPTVSRIFQLCELLKWGEAKSIKGEKIPAFKDIALKYTKNTNADGEVTDTYTFTNERVEKFKKQAAAAKRALTKAQKSGEDTEILQGEYDLFCSERDEACRELVMGFLTDCEDFIKAQNLSDLSFVAKAANQLEILGDIDLTTGKEEDRHKLYITDIYPLVAKKTGTVWAYSVKTKSIGRGKLGRWTIKAAKFDIEPVKKGDIIEFDPKTGYYTDRKGDQSYYTLVEYHHVYD